MKKAILAVLAVGLVIGGGIRQAFAQDKKVEFGLHVGAMSYIGSEGAFSVALLTISPQVDVHVTKGLMISPEVMFRTNFRFSGVVALPGVILNYTARGGFFAGAGAVLPVPISESMGGVTLLPKLNIGFRGKKISLTAYLISSTIARFSHNLVGGSLGYRF